MQIQEFLEGLGDSQRRDLLEIIQDSEYTETCAEIERKLDQLINGTPDPFSSSVRRSP